MRSISGYIVEPVSVSLIPDIQYSSNSFFILAIIL